MALAFVFNIILLFNNITVNAENVSYIPTFVSNEYVKNANVLYDYYLNNTNIVGNINNKFCYFDGQNQFYYFYDILIVTDPDNIGSRLFYFPDTNRVLSTSGNTYSAEIRVDKSNGNFSIHSEYSYITIYDTSRIYDNQILNIYYYGTEDIYCYAVQPTGAGQVANIGTDGLTQFVPDDDLDDDNPSFLKWIYNLTGTIRNTLNNIRNTVNEFKDNVSSKLEDIKQKIDYLKEPLNNQRLYTTFQNTNIYSLSQSVGTSVDNLSNLFTSVGSRTTATAYFDLDFSNVQFYQSVGNVRLDFSWYSSLKPYVNNLFKLFLILSLIIYILKTLPDLIRGASSHDN